MLVILVTDLLLSILICNPIYLFLLLIVGDFIGVVSEATVLLYYKVSNYGYPELRAPELRTFVT